MKALDFLECLDVITDSHTSFDDPRIFKNGSDFFGQPGVVHPDKVYFLRDCQLKKGNFIRLALGKRRTCFGIKPNNRMFLYLLYDLGKIRGISNNLYLSIECFQRKSAEFFRGYVCPERCLIMVSAMGMILC